MDVVKRVQEFLKYWYVRYLLVTEMYMVERWEQAVIYVMFAILFGTFWFFNYSIVLKAVSQLRMVTAPYVRTI